MLARFDRDALTKPGVRWILLHAGINHIMAADMLPTARDQVSAAGIIAGMKTLIAAAHGRGTKVWGATLQTRGGAAEKFGHTSAAERERLAVNDWICGAGSFDAVVDFDQALRMADHPDPCSRALTAAITHIPTMRAIARWPPQLICDYALATGNRRRRAGRQIMAPIPRHSIHDHGKRLLPSIRADVQVLDRATELAKIGKHLEGTALLPVPAKQPAAVRHQQPSGNPTKYRLRSDSASPAFPTAVATRTLGLASLSAIAAMTQRFGSAWSSKVTRLPSRRRPKALPGLLVSSVVLPVARFSSTDLCAQSGGGASHYGETAWQNDYMLTPGQFHVDIAQHTKIEGRQQRNEGYAVEWGPVLKTDVGRVQLNANLFFQRHYRVTTPGADNGTELAYQLQMKYRWKSSFQPGLQAFGEVGKWNHWLPASQQSHRVGPAFSGIGAHRQA